MTVNNVRCPGHAEQIGMGLEESQGCMGLHNGNEVAPFSLDGLQMEMNDEVVSSKHKEISCPEDCFWMEIYNI